MSAWSVYLLQIRLQQLNWQPRIPKLQERCKKCITPVPNLDIQLLYLAGCMEENGIMMKVGEAYTLVDEAAVQSYFVCVRRPSLLGVPTLSKLTEVLPFCHRFQHLQTQAVAWSLRESHQFNLWSTFLMPQSSLIRSTI